MKLQSQLKPALQHQHSVLTCSKMAAPHLQIAEQATVLPSLMTQWNEDNDMASITLVRPPATEYTMQSSTVTTTSLLTSISPMATAFAASVLNLYVHVNAYGAGTTRLCHLHLLRSPRKY